MPVVPGFGTVPSQSPFGLLTDWNEGSGNIVMAFSTVGVTIAFRLADGLGPTSCAATSFSRAVSSQSPFGLLTDWNYFSPKNQQEREKLLKSQSPFGLLTDWNREEDLAPLASIPTQGHNRLSAC